MSLQVSLAEDLDTDCAVVVVDSSGAVRAAERPGGVHADLLTRAVATAREVLAGDRSEASSTDVGAVVLDGGGLRRGALGISGGPEGFALAACRAVAGSLGLGQGDPVATA